MPSTIPAAFFGTRIHIDPRLKRLPPEKVRGLYVSDGAQIVRAGNVPQHKIAIKNLTLKGGASEHSPWGNLRGAVLKFREGRTRPININGKGFTVPSGYTLMDQESFIETKEIRNHGREVPHQVITDISPEPFYLVHSSFCHPKDLFVPQGTYTQTEYDPKNLVGFTHLEIRGDTLFLMEEAIPLSPRPFDVTEGMDPKPSVIVVQLEEGGHVTLAQ
ncbi:MAG: hypothetical protein NT099_08640 [Candidatus Saganbacteria bacterium]|nr:hypothetical protein [Candidatus Saganbacteria bacterium]